MAKPIKCVKFTLSEDGDAFERGSGDGYFDLCAIGVRKAFDVPQDARSIWVSLHARPSRRRVKVRLWGCGSSVWSSATGDGCGVLHLLLCVSEKLNRLAKKTGRREFYAEVHYSLT
jgi:hypothetical protein